MFELDRPPSDAAARMEAALTITEGGTEALAVETEPPPLPRAASRKVHLLPRIPSRPLFARAPTLRRDPSRDLIERARSGDLPADVPADVDVDDFPMLRAPSSLSLRSLREQYGGTAWPELREGGDLDEGAKAARIAEVAEKAVLEVAATRAEREQEVAGIDGKEETVNEEATGNEAEIANEEAVEVNDLPKHWDAVPSVSKRAGMRSRLRSLRKKRGEAANKSAEATDSSKTAAHADRERKLIKLRSRVRLLGAKRRSVQTTKTATQSVPTKEVTEAAGEEPSSPIKQAPSSVSEEPSLAHVIVTPVKVLAGDAKEIEEEDPADTPTTAASAASALPSPASFSVSTASPNSAGVPSGFTPSPVRSVVEGPSTKEQLIEESVPTGGQSLPPPMPVATAPKTVQWSDTYVSQEGQEQEDLSVVTIPCSEEAQEEERNGIDESSPKKANAIAVECMEGEVLVPATKELEVVPTTDEDAVAVECNEGEVLIPVVEEGEAPTTKTTRADVEDVDLEDEEDDPSIHIVYDNEAHGVIGKSTDVLVEVSSLQGEEDVEVIKCLGLEEIGLESGVEREPAEENEEGNEEMDLESKATKKSDRTAGTEGTTKASSAENPAEAAAPETPTTRAKRLLSKLDKAAESENPAYAAAPETPKTRTRRRRLRRLTARMKSAGDRRAVQRRFRRRESAEETAPTKIGLSSEAREAVAMTPEAQRELKEMDYIITPVPTPGLAKGKEHGLSAEAHAALGELQGIEVGEKQTGLSPKARYALAKEQGSADDMDIEVARSSDRSRRVPSTRSNATSSDEGTFDVSAEYASWDLDTLDSGESSFVTENSAGGDGDRQCAFAPFGIPQEELVEDLLEAFDDTVGQFMADIGFTGAARDADSTDHVREKARKRTRGGGARGGHHRSHVSKKDERRRRSHNEHDRRKEREGGNRAGRQSGGVNKSAHGAPFPTRRMEV